MNITIPDDIMEAAKVTPGEIMWYIAVDFLKREKITLEQASRLVGMTQSELLHRLTERMISTSYNATDVQRVIDDWRWKGWLTLNEL